MTEYYEKEKGYRKHMIPSALSYLDLDIRRRILEKAVGVPIKLLHEGEGHGVTVEMKNGEIYRGHLNEAEDTMNCFMTGVTMTGRDGRVSKLEQVYLRGSHVKLVVLPDILKNAPVFKPVQKMKKKEEEAGGNRGGGFKKTKKSKA